MRWWGGYTLHRIEDNGTTTEISTHDDLLMGIVAGGYAVDVEDHEFAYALYSGAARVATFCEGRIGYRAWATKTGRLSPSVEDRYDHDVDEMMV